MNYRLILALCNNVIQADFKSVKTKFLDQGAEETVIDKAFGDFKKLKDQNKIKKHEDKDINSWGKKSWGEFVDFVDEVKKQITETQKRKLAKKGATKVAENEHWRIYKIDTHEAAMYYGAGTKWCITQSDGGHWDSYNENNDFYFMIAKDRPASDPFYKIAVQASYIDKSYWDAEDESYNYLPDDVKANVPKYTFPKVDIDIEVDGEKYPLRRLLEEGLPNTAKRVNLYNLDVDVAGNYLPAHNFIVVEEYNNVEHWAYNDDTEMSRLLEAETNNELIYIDDSSNWLKASSTLETILDLLEEKHYEDYKKLYHHLVNLDEFKEHTEKFELDKRLKGEFEYNNEDLGYFLSTEEPDVYHDFKKYVEYATQSAAASEFHSSILKYFQNNPFVVLKVNDSVFDKIYKGFYLTDLRHMLDTGFSFDDYYKENDDTHFDFDPGDLSSTNYDEEDVVNFIYEYGFDIPEKKTPNKIITALKIVANV